VESSATRILEPFLKGMKQETRISPLNRQWLYLSSVFLLALFLAPALVSAEGIGGFVELDYVNSTIKSEDAAGVKSESHTNSYVQRYYLTLDKTIYPNLKFLASGTFEHSIAKGEQDGVDIDSKDTAKYGQLGLRLATRLISAGIGYTKREDKASSLGQTAPESVQDTYSANLSLRPEGLPQVDVLFLRTDIYDKGRLFANQVTDSTTLGLRYTGFRGLELYGTALFTDETDHIANFNLKQQNYSARASYWRHFFGDRVSAYASYAYHRLDTQTAASGGGEVPVPVLYPGDYPHFYSLINNNATTSDWSLYTSYGIFFPTGIDIGTAAPDPDMLRQIVFDSGFTTPQQIDQFKVNTIYAYVDKEVHSIKDQFEWAVYVGEETIPGDPNTVHWTNVPTVSVDFDAYYNRFKILVNTVSARYLKVVVSPLPPGVIDPGTDVTHVQVLNVLPQNFVPAQQLAGKNAQSQHSYELDVKTKILDAENLFYDFYFSGNTTSPGITAWTLANSLHMAHRFNRVFFGSAEIRREDSKQGLYNTSSNQCNLSVSAVPLPTLYHSLSLSARLNHSVNGNSSSYSAFLNNTAELYRGVHLNVSVGESLSADEAGVRTLSTIVNSGASVVPHPKLNVNVFFSTLMSSQTGGSQAVSSNNSKRAAISASYTPFSTLYLFGSYGIQQEAGQKTFNTSNFSLSWSPFQGGDLQFGFVYNVSTSSANQKQRTISPSMRWLLRQNAALEAAYTILKSDSPALLSSQKVLSLRLTVGL
jgi:hypothetical protein